MNRLLDGRVLPIPDMTFLRRLAMTTLGTRSLLGLSFLLSALAPVLVCPRATGVQQLGVQSPAHTCCRDFGDFSSSCPVRSGTERDGNTVIGCCCSPVVATLASHSRFDTGGNALLTPLAVPPRIVDFHRPVLHQQFILLRPPRILYSVWRC